MGIKAFLIDSGVKEFPMVNESQLREGMKILAPLKVPLILHAELESPVGQDHGTEGGSGSDYQNYLHSRPSQWEVDAIRLVIKLMKETGCRCHIVHLSASEALPDIKEARSQGLPLTVETCPHYLVFDSESIAAGMTQFKCAPPIRPKANKEKLWQALMDGDIDMIVSDHSPCTPPLKKLSTGDFFDAWGGISGLQLSLPAVWTEMERRKIPVSLISQWMCSAPAHFVGIHRQKGALKTGLDADIVIWNPEEEFLVTPEIIKHRHHLTPYEGQLMKGRVIKTLVRGKTVFENDQFAGKTSGQWIQPKSEWNA
jgi:allantoinase